MKKYLLAVLPFFLLSISFAQKSAPEAYLQAEIALESKKYWEAIPLFKQFTDPKQYGNLANYAAFHLGEAAIAVNQPTQAVEALEPLITRNWAKSDDAKYLLSIAYFKNQQNIEALQTIKKIKSDQIMKLAENASFENLKQVSSSFLIANLQEFKDNEGYKAVLGKVLESQSILSATERAAYYELQGNKISQTAQSKDEVLDIVVILPFTNSPTSSLSTVSTNDFVFELYRGIELGVEQLKIEGVKVNLMTFDSKRDLGHLQQVLSEPALSKADIIVGPIYQEETDLVSNFAETAKIPFVHPLSNLGDRFENFKYSYLFRPSISSLADGIVKSLKNQMWGKRVAIGYSKSSRDEMLAKLLQEKLSQENFTVVKFEQVNPANTSEFLRGLGVKSGSMSRSADQIILLTDDPAIAQPAFGLMESITASIPTLVMDSWLSFNFANYEMLEFPNFYFISNNTLNFYNESMKQWRNTYYKKYLNLPSMNSSIGRELVFWISSNMSDSKGFDLRANLNKSAFEVGNLTWGFNFQNSNNNNYVPVFTLDAGELKPLQ
jgi:hypothetical protein